MNNEKQIIAIQKVSNAVASLLDLEKMLQVVLDSITEGLSYQASAILLVTEDGKFLKGTTTSGSMKTISVVEKAIGKKISDLKYLISNTEKRNLAVQSVKYRKVFSSNKLFDFAVPIMKTDVIPKLVQGIYGMDYIASIPMIARKKVIGVILVGRKRDDLSSEEKELVQLFANQTGIAIENARLYQKITNFNKELKQKVAEATEKIQGQYQDLLVLRKITDVITSTLDLQKVSQEIVNSVTSRLNFVAGLINLIDANTYQLYPVAFSKNLASEKVLGMVGSLNRYRLPVDDNKNLLARVASTMKIQATDDITEVLCPPLDTRIAQRLQKMNRIVGIMVLPIIAQGRVLGTLSIGLDKSSRQISDQEKQTMQTLAKEAGLAIDNAMLFEKTQKFNDQLKQEVSRATWELRNANEKLTKLDKAKSEFISIASHQLRTPLSTIKGYLAMILDGDYGIISEAVARVLHRVYNSNERLVVLVNNMLNVSRIESGRIKFDPRPLDVVPLIEEVVGELAPEVRSKRIEVVFKKPNRESRLVRADKRLVHEVLFNLIDNAIKYTQHGKVEITLHKRDYGLEIRIKDTGVGIAAEDLGHLFRKFTRGRDAYRYYTGGSGLGLFVVKKLVEMNGGEINASSRGAGKGSTFKFTIPYA
jgi:signal transduction histidine kinase